MVRTKLITFIWLHFCKKKTYPKPICTKLSTAQSAKCTYRLGLLVIDHSLVGLAHHHDARQRAAIVRRAGHRNPRRVHLHRPHWPKRTRIRETDKSKPNENALENVQRAPFASASIALLTGQCKSHLTPPPPRIQIRVCTYGARDIWSTIASAPRTHCWACAA